MGNLLKTDVRKIAERENLITFDKKDSTGICFIGERPFPEFLKNYLPEEYGEIVDDSGEVIGSIKDCIFILLDKGKVLELADWRTEKKRLGM